MTHTLIIALGGAIGASLRHLTGLVLLRLIGPGFPFGTLTVNVVGSFAMGLLVATLARMEPVAPEWRLFLGTGLLGGFTTFSAFSLDAALLYERGELGLAGAYVAMSVILSLCGLFLGLWVARSLAG